MKPTAELRNDHEVLRGKLDLLEGLLPLVSTTRFPVRDLVYSIARRLQCHTEKEALVLQALIEAHGGAAAPVTARLADEHRDQQATLARLNELLAGGPGCPADEVCAYGSHLIDELREHMAHEEARVFPVADRVLGVECCRRTTHGMHDIAHRHYPEGEPHRPGVRPAWAPITQEMTVNHVLWTRPQLRRTLEAFGVNCAEDGVCCLDELYWRHGIELDALLRALNGPGQPSRHDAAAGRHGESATTSGCA